MRRAYSVKIRVIFGVRFERRKVDKRANLHENWNMHTSILESFEYFLPNIKIDPYHSELYRFKVGAFFRHSVYFVKTLKPTILPWILITTIVSINPLADPQPCVLIGRSLRRSTKVQFTFSKSTTPCPKKTCDYIFYNNFNKKCPITIIFGIVSSKSMRHRKMVSFPTSPI